MRCRGMCKEDGFGPRRYKIVVEGERSACQSQGFTIWRVTKTASERPRLPTTDQTLVTDLLPYIPSPLYVIPRIHSGNWSQYRKVAQAVDIKWTHEDKLRLIHTMLVMLCCHSRLLWVSALAKGPSSGALMASPTQTPAPAYVSTGHGRRPNSLAGNAGGQSSLPALGCSDTCKSA